MRHLLRFVLVGMLVGLGMGVLSAFGQEITEQSVLEQLLDLLLQRGQIDREQYRALQEKVKREHVSAFQAGIEDGRPFFKSTDGNFQVELGGRLQVDFESMEMLGIRLPQTAPRPPYRDTSA